MYSLPQQTVIDDYFSGARPHDTDENWLLLPEVPDSNEMSRPIVTNDPRVVENKIEGNWSSKEEHLMAQYEFLREESTFALRRAIGLVREDPLLQETDHRDISPGIGIYEKTFVTGITLCKRGLGVRMCFSTFRAGVKIDWNTSKRLKAGSLIALSPASDKFKKFIVIAVVAARPVFLLTQGIPMIDIFFPRAEETIFDPVEEYVMIEETSSFFEAQRHNMLALQRMSKEKTPLQDYVITPLQDELDEPSDLLIDISDGLSDKVAKVSITNHNPPAVHSVGVPRYVQNDPILDLSNVTDVVDDGQFNILSEPLPDGSSCLDKSQMDALHQILTRELALIQGPPGTGKTHVSVIALQIILKKMEEQRQKAGPGEVVPPLIVACQTNHALDQLLRHVAKFEDSFIRLGGRSADKGIVRQRTLFNIMDEMNPGDIVEPKDLRNANKVMILLEKDFKRELEALDNSRSDHRPMDEDMFPDHLTEKHIDSLKNSKWQTSSDASDASAIVKWLGQDTSLISSNTLWPSDQDFGFESFEDEEEVVDEATAEKGIADDEIEMLKGGFIPLVDRSVLSSSIKRLSAQEVKKILNSSKFSDLNKLPLHFRLSLYKFLVEHKKKKIIKSAQNLACKWAAEVDRRARGVYAKKLQLLQDAKVIGCSSTGFAKYRPMVYALKPRIVLIEEAGECLEANMMSVFLPSLQHLILVGDHQQLRPRAQKASHNFLHYDISLFERLASNTVDYKMLAVQRRMPPEVRRLLWPIYGDKIQDHECTLDRPPVPGLGKVKTWFFHHENLEAVDKFKSTYNELEAILVVDFVNGLVSENVQPENITVLTFYNGQRRVITRELKRVEGLGDKNIKVVTVDSYQGEENDIILLSLVRNNFIDTVGFLNVANRVCVALSRARQGLFLFGNVNLLERAGGPEWQQVIQILRGEGPPETQIVTETRITKCE